MSRDKQIDEMALTDVDILANDINQHCPDLAENYCGGTHCVACLANALTAKGYRKASEVARETVEAIKAEVSKKEQYVNDLFGYGGYVIATTDLEDIIRRFMFDNYEEAELKKKYTEEGK